MHTFILVAHVILAVSLVCVILMQRSEGGALGGLGGASMGNFMTGRTVGNLLTRTTAILATCFMLTSITLAILSKSDVAQAQKSFLDEPAIVQKVATPQKQAEPTVPVVPISSK